MKVMKKSLAGRLEFLISSLNVKRQEFADRVGFSLSYVALLLNGTKKTPSDRFFDAVAREFSVNPEWLRSGKGDVYLVPGLSLVPSEAEILARYKLLPAEDQAIIEKIINSLIIKSQGEEHSAKKQLI
jgi:transcriptional regulator with XRE-family HTH domain